jgi:hypothetical protein
MLKIMHDGIHANLDIDTTNFNGDVEHDSQLAEVTVLVAGVLAAVEAVNGYVVLADGALASALHPIGFVINDAAGYFYMNKPAIASKKVPVLCGNAVLITDKIDTALTFAPGELLYAGTGAKIGLVTNVQPLNGFVIGIALSAASAAAPELTLFAK